MTEVAYRNLDPAVEIVERAREQGLFTEYELRRDGIDLEDFENPLLLSRVSCAPAEGGVFEPEELNQILHNVTGLEVSSRYITNKGKEVTIPANFRGRLLELPQATVVRNIGTYSCTGVLEIEGIRRSEYVEEAVAYSQTNVKVFPSRRLLERFPSLGIIAPVLVKGRRTGLSRGDAERVAFEKVYKKHVRWFDRMSDL